MIMPICSYFYEHTTTHIYKHSTTPNIDLSENLNACCPPLPLPQEEILVTPLIEP